MSPFYLLLLNLFQAVLTSHPFFGHVPIPSDQRPSFIKDESQIAENRLNLLDLPESIDWRNHNGNNYMSWTRNQHIPSYCGSCWVFSATSALSARVMIARDNVFPEISLSPQLILDCDDTGNYGCSGGDALSVYAWFHENGAVEDSCNPYVAESWFSGERECNAYSYCSYSDSRTDVNDEYLYPNPPILHVDEFGFTEKGEESMIKLLNEGPIVCAMAVTDDFYDNYKGGIYVDSTGTTAIDHEIVVMGYGIDPTTDTKYWIAMNSWGTAWGENGYFRIIRGVNNLAIEEYCVWGNLVSDNLNVLDVRDSIQLRTSTGLSASTEGLGGCLLGMRSDTLLDDSGIQTSPLPQVYLAERDIPIAFTWFDINGRNLLNIVRQSNKPYRCDSCWAFVVAEIISDRLNVMEYLSGNMDYLEVNLSPQVLINMVENCDCNGGYAADAMKYLYDVGVSDETCQNYVAESDPHPDKPEFNVCYSCDSDGSCYEVTPNKLYRVQEYGYVYGVMNMKNEIYARGPIGCAMIVDGEFEEYSGGIYSSQSYCDACEGDKEKHDYMVSIVGWGYDGESEQEYWIGKNNWGIGWGEDGYFRMKMGVNSNYIEEQCIWGIPQFEDELLVLTQRMNEIVTPERKEFSFASWLPRLGKMSVV